ncbi:MAG: hypothetical protein DCC46_11855 [Armatimonadetes bacterium]|nr:MAG: hypothetical protein DCC46_11855 [Armatimonadota bacterium]
MVLQKSANRRRAVVERHLLDLTLGLTDSILAEFKANPTSDLAELLASLIRLSIALSIRQSKLWLWGYAAKEILGPYSSAVPKIDWEGLCRKCDPLGPVLASQLVAALALDRKLRDFDVSAA